jgi:hypothetical protein
MELREAVEGVEKLFAEIQRSSVDGTSASKALGYSSEHGASRTKLGALNAYGLIDRGKKLVTVTELGIAIAHPLEDSRARGLKEAALRPPLFKEIWENHRQCSESVLASTLVHKGLDTGSAAQAAKIFKANIAFAGLTDSNYNPQEKPPKPQNGQGGGGAPEKIKQQIQPPMTADIRYLPIPLDIGDAPIPVGMSNSDFDLLLETLKLWKKKIVRHTDATHDFSFNSLADLDRQIKTFSDQHPRARLDEAQIKTARAHATKMDNDGETVGERVTFNVSYTEIP